MKDWRILPAIELPATTSLSGRFRRRELITLREAARYLQRFPYGRTSDRSDPSLVLKEQRGTCSTKHALLFQLAKECDVAVELMLGIYEMCEANTPGVGAVLDGHGLAVIPEAHVYLRYDEHRVDITRSAAEPASDIGQFLSERVIRPEDIGERKVELHRSFIRQWLQEHPKLNDLTPKQLWTIREECISALTAK